jgi:hypothetical protein
LKALHLEITFYNKITPVRQRCIDVVFIDEVKSTAYGSTSGCGLIHTHVMVWVILIVNVKEHIVVRKDIDVNENNRLSNIALRHTLK